MLKSSKIVILTEGGYRFGLGHMSRCFSLYQALKRKVRNVKLIVHGDSAVEKLFTGKQISYYNWKEEYKRTIEFLRNSDIVVIDSYYGDRKFYERFTKYAKTGVFFDDDLRMEYPEGYIINPALNAKMVSYNFGSNHVYLLGSEYQILQKTLWRRKRYHINEKITNILITFGAADLTGTTCKVLSFLVNKYSGITKKVVIGRWFENKAKIEKAADNNTQIINSPNPVRMINEMRKSDLVITAGGQTLYESACVGIPAIAVLTAGNQDNNITGWNKAGFIEFAGKATDNMFFDNLERGINLLRDRKERLKRSNIGTTLVDGKGVERIVKVLLKG